MKNKYLKKTLVVIAICIALCISYIIIDCVRLRYGESGTKPLITSYEEANDTRITYHGLGYSVSYYVSTEDVSGGNEDKILADAEDIIRKTGYGAEFRLFDKIMIWGWIE